MPRCILDEDEILTAFRDRLDERPAAGLVVGTVEIDAEDGSATVWMQDTACSPVHLVMMAGELLDTAAAQASAMPGLDSALALTRAINSARTALGLTGAPRPH